MNAENFELTDLYQLRDPAQNAAERKRFQGALRKLLSTLLPPHGFVGQGSIRRRFRPPGLHIVSTQAWKYGGGLCLNLGIHFGPCPQRPGFPDRLEDMEEVHCAIRKRLAPPGHKGDFWWRYGKDAPESQASAQHLIDTLQAVGLPFLEALGNWPGPYFTLNQDNSDAFFRKHEVLFPGPTGGWRLVQLLQQLDQA